MKYQLLLLTALLLITAGSASKASVDGVTAGVRPLHRTAAFFQNPDAWETDAPEPPSLPADCHTNITDHRAAVILSEIYDTVISVGDAAVYFTDTEEEYFFGIGEDKLYHTASTIKPVYCQYLLETGIDPETKVTLQNISRSSSSGKLTADALGKSFTVAELMEYSIRYSDNQAHRLLFETFGVAGYNRYVSAFDGMYMAEEWEWPNASPRMLSRAVLAIYRYGGGNSVIVDHMRHTTYNRQIGAGTKYPAAHKYGSNGGTDGYHDTAIVFAPERPYILTIMTHLDTSVPGDHNAVFRRVAELCDELHGVLFSAKE